MPPNPMPNFSMWDERYNQPDYVYGTTPNDFLVEVIGQIPKGRILCLADGEGRNGVYLAKQGGQVTSIDASPVGLAKARKLAAENSVEIETIVADLAEFSIQPNSWDAIVSIFCHLSPSIRSRLYRQVVSGLRPGGVFVLEGYTPRQLEFKTGGPSDVEFLLDLPTLQRELEGLEFKHAIELEREIQEGLLHQGRSAVLQILAVKSA